MSQLSSVLNFICVVCGMMSICIDIPVVIITRLSSVYGLVLLAFIILNSSLIIFHELTVRYCTPEDKRHRINVKPNAFIFYVICYITSIILYVTCNKLSVMQIIIISVFKALFAYIYYLDVIRLPKSDVEYHSLEV